MKVGFKPVVPFVEDKPEFIIDLTKIAYDLSYFSNFGEDSKFHDERLQTLRKRANHAFRILSKISDELLMVYGDDKELKGVADDVYTYTWKIEDIIWERKRDK